LVERAKALTAAKNIGADDISVVIIAIRAGTRPT
jgi:hypothetical protein